MTKRTPLEEALWTDGRLNKERQAALDALRRGPIAGLMPCRVITFSTATYALTITPLFFHGDDRPRKIQLPPPKDEAGRWQPFAQKHLAIFGGNQQKVGDFPLDDNLGLISLSLQCYRYSEDFRHAPYLPWTTAAITNGHGQGQGYGPADLFLDPAGRLAVVSDRGQGLLYHLDLHNLEHVGTYRLRGKGGTSGMSVAFADSRLIVADHHSKGLILVDLDQQKYHNRVVEWGQPSQVLVAPDQQSLFVLAVMPEFCVYQVDAKSLQPMQRFPLKGYPFSRREDPCDSMAMSQDGRYLFVLTGLNEPQPKTPIVNVLEVATGKNVHRYRLKPEKKPVGLAFGVENPYYAPPLSVPEALIRLGFLTLEELAEFQQRIASERQTELFLASSEGAQETGEEGAPPLQQLAGGYEWRRFDTQPAKHLHLPDHVEVLIANYLNQRYMEESGLDLWERPQAWQRLLNAAAHMRQELQFFNGVEATLNNLEGHDLHVAISRDLVEEWLVTVERDDMLKGVVVYHSPDRCPQCGTPLFGVYDCPACGLETVVSTQRLFDPRTLSQATVHPFAFLESGHLLFPDARRRRLVELDDSGIITWQLQADILHPDLQALLQEPVDALRLANGHTLIVDRATRRVFEVSPGGRPYWEWPRSSVPIQEPVRVARSEWGDTLLADRGGHRVLRLDPLGRPGKGYGTGEPGLGRGQLREPCDIQVLNNGHLIIADSGNRRVIEVRGDEIVWQIGGLDCPTRAHRFDNGLTLILDTGAHRLVAVNPFGVEVFSHDTLDEENGIPMDAPVGMAHLAEGRILYWDGDGAVEIDSEGRALWAAHFEQMETHPRLQVAVPDAWDPEGLKPRRVFRVKRLRPDELRKKRLEAQARLKRAQAARKAFKHGIKNAYEELLRRESKRRLAESKQKPRVWKVDFEAVRSKLRSLSQTRLAAHDKQRELLLRKKAAAPAQPAAIAVLAQRRPDRLVMVGSNGQAIWTWGEGLLKQPHSANILTNGRVLAVDTHHHRVLEIDPVSHQVVWEFKQGLVFPRSARRLPDGHTLIADSGNKRVIEVSAQGEVLWQWGGHGRLNLPNYADRLANGHTLIADGGDHRILDIDTTGEICWQYGGRGNLNSPESAQRLPNGHTLIADSHHHQVIEVDPQGNPAWAYFGEGWRQLSFPTYAERLTDGNTLILHAGGRAAEKVSPEGKVVWRAWVPLKGTQRLQR